MVRPSSTPPENPEAPPATGDGVADACDPADKRGKRHYVGTKNNYTEEDIKKLDKWGTESCTYLVYGKEVGKKGTPHLQIYMEFPNTISMKAITKKLFPMWLGFRKGTPKQAAGYCKKGSDKPPEGKGYDYFFDRTVHFPETWELGGEFGEISQQGKRTDIDNVVEAVVGEKKSIREVAMDYPAQFVKYHKGLVALRQLTLLPRRLSAFPKIVVYYGPTGCGKTWNAYNAFDGLGLRNGIDFYEWNPQQANWFDQYDGQDYILLQEFRGQLQFGALLALLDQYACRMQYKGGTCQIQAHTFYITSPIHPSQWYKYEDMKGNESMEQLRRRLVKEHPESRIMKCPRKYVPPVDVGWPSETLELTEVEAAEDARHSIENEKRLKEWREANARKEAAQGGGGDAQRVEAAPPEPEAEVQAPREVAVNTTPGFSVRVSNAVPHMSLEEIEGRRRARMERQATEKASRKSRKRK